MSRKRKKPEGTDWLAWAQRFVVFARGLRGDEHAEIDDAHQRELARSQKIRDFTERLERVAGKEG